MRKTRSCSRVFGAFSVLSLSLCHAHALALEPLAVYLASADERAYAVREAELDLVQQKAALNASYTDFLPTLDATGRYVRNQYQAIVPANALTGAPKAVFLPYNQRELTLTATLPLFDLGRFRRVGAEKRSHGAKKASLSARRLEARRSVARAYFGVVAAEALHGASVRAVEAADKNLSNIRARREAGLASELDERRAEAEVERKRQVVADAVYERAVTRRSLATESGTEPTPGAPPLPMALEAEQSLDTWLSRVGADLPSVAVAREERRASEALTRFARAQLAPTLLATATEKFTNAPGFGHQPFYAVGVSANLHFDATAIPEIQKQQASERSSHIREEQTLRAALDSVHNAWFDVQRNLEKTRAADRELIAAKLATQVAHERYGAGTATFLDVVLAERDELTAEASHIEAAADFCAAKLELRLLAGKSEDLRVCEEDAR